MNNLKETCMNVRVEVSSICLNVNAVGCLVKKLDFTGKGRARSLFIICVEF